MTEVTVSFNQVADALERVAFDNHPSEVQGLMAGWVSVKGESQDWRETLFPGLAVPQALEELYKVTKIEMFATDFSFHLLLPGEDAELARRAEAMTEWCLGYLAGIAYSEIDVTTHDDLKEVVEDLTKISQMDYEGADESESDENALVEVEEFVRMSALLVATEMQHDKQGE